MPEEKESGSRAPETEIGQFGELLKRGLPVLGKFGEILYPDMTQILGTIRLI